MMYNRTQIRRGLLGVAGLALCHPLTAIAQTATPDAAEQEEIGRLQAHITELQAREAVYVDRLQALEERLQAVERNAHLLTSPIPAGEAAEMRGAYITPRPVMLSDDASLAFFRQDDARGDAIGPISASTPADENEGDRKAPAPTDAVEEITRQQQGRFGSRLGLEVGLGYTHFDSARINLNGFLALDAIFLGTISIDQVTSDIFTFDPTVRFGLNDRLFFDASLPYLYRSSNFRSGGAGGSASALVEETVHDDGFGDLTIGANYRLARESGSIPDIVLNARVKFPTGRHAFGVEFVEVANSEGNLEVPERLATGSGVYGASLGLSVLKTLDPMVVFGSVTYFKNFSRHFSDLNENPGEVPGRVDVGDAYQFGAGLAFALNDKSSISMSVTERIVSRTTLQPDGQNSRIVVGSQANVGLVNLGATFSLGPRLALVTNVGIGLTDDSPDMALSIRLPYRF